MKRIINVPIESLEERYSANWARWFPKEFERLRVNFITINPTPLSDKIRDGRFLDICGTNYYKAMQLAEICKLTYEGKITNNDAFLIHDYWYPGIEMLAYIRDAMKIDFKIYGLLHAGTYDETDFITQVGMGYWGEHLENAWLRICDKIFLQTQWHKNLIVSKRDVDPKKLVITGHPTYYEQDPSKFKKEKIVVFPHRLDPEKHPEMFDYLASVLRSEFPDWKFVRTKEVTRTKQEYYDLLERATIAVSYASQENWGNAMIEATFARCYPIVPDRIAYAEMYHPIFKFGTMAESIAIVRDIIIMKERSYGDWQGHRMQKYDFPLNQNRFDLLKKGEHAIENMVNEIMKG